jgi:excisionase family DNA binding protein
MTTAVPALALSPQQVLLTPLEAAAVLRVSRTRLFALMRSRQIRSITLGRIRRIPIEAVHEFVAAQLAAQQEEE